MNATNGPMSEPLVIEVTPESHADMIRDLQDAMRDGFSVQMMNDPWDGPKYRVMDRWPRWSPPLGTVVQP